MALIFILSLPGVYFDRLDMIVIFESEGVKK